MSKNQTQVETSALFAVSSTVSDCAGKSATRGRGGATLTLAAALALTLGGVSSALATDARFNVLYNFYAGNGAPLGIRFRAYSERHRSILRDAKRQFMRG